MRPADKPPMLEAALPNHVHAAIGQVRTSSNAPITSAPTKRKFIIEAAEHGGFVVTEWSGMMGEVIRPLVAASTLQECFDFIQTKWLMDV